MIGICDEGWYPDDEFTCAGYSHDEAFANAVSGLGSWTRIDGANDADGDGICDITLAPEDNPPVANAGDDQSIRAGQTVYLSGTGSDDNTPPEELEYAWTFYTLPTGSEEMLQDADTAEPWFTADLADIYEVQLTVTDSLGQTSEPDLVMVSADNLAPTADAGMEQLVFVNAEVTLDGTSSADPEDDPLGYAWTLAVPEGSSAVLTGADTATPWFTADVPGEYTASLMVRDPLGPGTSDEVAVTASTASDYAEARVVETAALVEALPVTAVKALGNRVALTNLLGQSVKAGQKGDVAYQVKKITDAMSRTDGCVLRGEPDGKGSGMDWVTDCDAQLEAYYALEAALDALTAP